MSVVAHARTRSPRSIAIAVSPRSRDRDTQRSPARPGKGLTLSCAGAAHSSRRLVYHGEVRNARHVALRGAYRGPRSVPCGSAAIGPTRLGQAGPARCVFGFELSASHLARPLPVALTPAPSSHAALHLRPRRPKPHVATHARVRGPLATCRRAHVRPCAGYNKRVASLARSNGNAAAPRSRDRHSNRSPARPGKGLTLPRSGSALLSLAGLSRGGSQRPARGPTWGVSGASLGPVLIRPDGDRSDSA